MKKILAIIIFCLGHFEAFPQLKNFSANIEARAGFISPSAVPFWLRSNTFGRVPLSGLSTSFLVSASKSYDTTRNRIIDWGASIEGNANLGKGSNLTLIEGYGKIKISIFEIRGGRSKEVQGLNDTLLTSGNFGISGNALGIPKIQLAIPDYYAIPILKKFIAIKGIYAHGWLDSTLIQQKRVSEATTYYHQKSLFARFGVPNSKLKIYAGFSDQVFWGSEAKIFESFIMSDWESYKSVVFGKKWALSKVGNHVGNIDVRADYEFQKVRIGVYRQSFYEVGALYYLANIADGINGIAIANKQPQTKKHYWKKFVFEFFYSKNQAGEPWSKPTPSGNENYYNHNLYREGWSYKGEGLGNPLITPKIYVREGMPNVAKNYFINNRIIALHSGADVILGRLNVLSKITYSQNYGTHHTSNTFQMARQFSGYFKGYTEIGQKIKLGVVAAFDVGKLYNNSGAVMAVASKSF